MKDKCTLKICSENPENKNKCCAYCRALWICKQACKLINTKKPCRFASPGSIESKYK